MKGLSAAEGVPEGAEGWLLTALPTAGTARPPLDGPPQHIPMATTVHPLTLHIHLFIHIKGGPRFLGKDIEEKD